MTLAQLKYVVTVAEIKAINAAAKAIYISQSSLSAAIRDLEQEIGVDLFERTNRGIVVTEEGNDFIVYAKNILFQYNLLEARYFSSDRKRYNFCVSMHHSTFTVRLFAEVVKKFGMHDYEYSIFETTTENVIKDVQTGKSELGILYISSFSEKIYEKIFNNAGVDFHVLAECPIYAYINKHHPLAGKVEVTMEELEDYPCLLFEQGDNGFYFYEEMISEYEYKNVIKTSDRATTIGLLNDLDAYSIGIGITSDKLLQDSIKVVKITSEEKIKAGYLIRKNEKLSIPGEEYMRKIRDCLNSDMVVTGYRE